MARLDRKERNILKSVEQGEWRSAASKGAVKRYVQAARRVVKKNHKYVTGSLTSKR